MYTKDEAYQKIEELTIRFSEQIQSYKKSDYNETLVRRDFIDPFFKALGWDVDNSQGYAEAYREVIHEDRIKVGSATKAPDYSFRLPGGKRLFFVEAKKPSVAVKTDMVPAYQVRRYAWSAKLPISLLTDFEEFAVYDCNKKPKPEDKASIGRIKYLLHTDYLKEFDFLWNTFSKERVLKGSFDKFIAGDGAKRGTTTVDKDFLQSLDGWRIQLAQNIALRNEAFTEDELNFTVQQTLDRIIFLRIAEDRSVEEYGRMKTALKGENYYTSLFTYFKDADDKYNSGLFDFKKDKLSRNLIIDNKVLKTIITDLYYPVSPYEFSVLSVEILGSAYEQFLGKQIKLSDRHKAVIEEKPEVRKAGGVYYTPQYIVDYIVGQTVGKLTEGKTPEQVAKLTIVDPACGSGSFLIGAYQFLLNWHLAYYKPAFTTLSETAADTTLPTKAREAAIKQRSRLPLTPDGNLTTALKKKILTNNIFGVDIDTQAVEVTKLSLLLKCMEGETGSSMTAEISFGERVLPTLDNNIKSGNSLIDLDFYDGEFDFEPGAEKAIKPFSWQQAFPAVFKRDGFDAIIGNPPYLKLTVNNTDKILLDYYNLKYQSYSGGSSKNLFQLFLEKITVAKPKIFSFIIPEALLTTESNGKIREILLDAFNISSIATFDHFVFEDATIGTTIIVGENSAKSNTEIIKINTAKQQQLIQEIKLNKGLNPWNVSTDSSNKNLFERIENSSFKMGELVEMSKGMVVKNRNEVLTLSPSKMSLPFLLGNCMNRYTYKYDKYATYENLEIIGGTRDLKKHMVIPRLLIRRTGSSLCATYSDKLELIESTIYFLRSDKVNIKFLLGLINSKLLSYYLSKKLITNTQGFPQVLMGQLELLPIMKATLDKTEEVVKLVDAILLLNKEKQQTTLPEKLEQLQHRINYTDDKINKLVYELYSLNEEEIAIIENQ